MTRPINIYLLSRVRDEESFRILEDYQSQKNEKSRIQYHEMESLRRLVNRLTDAGLTVDEMDRFYYGYHIPRIGKEFDLLKLTGNAVVNIELKSQEVPEDQILKQLLKNRYYLSHLGRRLYLYTVVTNTMRCYRLTVNDELAATDIGEIAGTLKKLKRPITEPIDDLFKSSEYLVSPSRTPEKFIQGAYFLTQAQEQVKKDVLGGIEKASGGAFFHVYGRTGTGKTLMIYDIAKTLARIGSVLILQYGELKDGQRKISEEIKGLTIRPSASLDDPSFSTCEYSFVLADEAQRLTPAEYEKLLYQAKKNEQICIFSTDKEQILTAAEAENDIEKRIGELTLAGSYELTERIRMNKELYSFILCLKKPARRKDQALKFTSVDLNYADTTQEAQNILEYYRERGYVFINYAKTAGEYDPFSEYEEDFDVLHVIGSEYEKVVMLMDGSFYYDENGYLQGIPYPNPDYLYPNLFYQGITRVREKLSLIILKQPDLFRQISGILKDS